MPCRLAPLRRIKLAPVPLHLLRWRGNVLSVLSAIRAVRTGTSSRTSTKLLSSISSTRSGQASRSCRRSGHKARTSRREPPEAGSRPEGDADADRRKETGEGGSGEKADGQAAAEVGLASTMASRKSQSAGLLLFRGGAADLEVLLGHPGGPFWQTKDDGAWSISKGLIGADEAPLSAARRESQCKA
jgi:hypothetical protein